MACHWNAGLWARSRSSDCPSVSAAMRCRLGRLLGSGLRAVHRLFVASPAAAEFAERAQPVTCKCPDKLLPANRNHFMESSKALPNPPRGALRVPPGSSRSPGAAVWTWGRRCRRACSTPSSVSGPCRGRGLGAPVWGIEAGTLLPCSQRCRGTSRLLASEWDEVPRQHPPASPAALRHDRRPPSANVSQPSSREVQC